MTRELADLAILLAAIVGAIALGLGIVDYFAGHLYVLAYLLAYAGFCLADILLRGNDSSAATAFSLGQHLGGGIPVLILFAAAPFERTVFYSGETPAWLGAFGLLVELSGLWMALGSRIQLAYFSPEPPARDRRTLVTTGFYRYIRHPAYLGVFMALAAWPLEYGAPVVLGLAVGAGVLLLRYRIRYAEAEMLALFGDEYDAYRRATDAVIPGLW